jgi:hypothetical protein
MPSVDWGQADFVVTVAVLLASAPLSYLSWASGFLGEMYEMAKSNHWRAPKRNRTLTGDWRSRAKQAKR